METAEGSVTAVVTTRNRLGRLRLTLASVLAQADVDLEVVVVDEASSDGTSELLASLDDPRLRVVRNSRPSGPSAARNAGVAAARGRWVAICDDDDLWAPTKLRCQLDAVAAEPGARWACSGTISFDDERRVIGHKDIAGGDVLTRMLEGNVMPSTSGVLVERALYDEVGGFDEVMWFSEDWDLWIRLAAASPIASAHAPVVGYRIAAGGSLSGRLQKMRESAVFIQQRYADLAAERRVTVDLDAHERYLADQALKARDRLSAARSFLHLARRDRSAGDVARAAVAVAAPHWLDRRGDERAAARVPATWRAEFDAWSSALRPL